MRVIVYRFTGRHGLFTVPERWCEECDLTVRAVERVAREFPGTEVEVRPWFRHLPAALWHRVWHPPGVVVDGRRIIQTRVPTEEFLREAFRRAEERARERRAASGTGAGG